jgi:dolichyl-phosphate-mannose-protein mannosyltransferase
MKVDDRPQAPARPTPVAARASTWEPALRRSAWAFGVFAASRIVTLAAFALSGALTKKTMIGALTEYDGLWYTQIAANGYPASLPPDRFAGPHAFFPAYPLLVRGVHEWTRLSIGVSAVLVSMLLGALAVALLYELLRHYLDDDASRRSVALFCFFPGSLVLSMAYADSLFLVAVLWFMLSMRREQYVSAGIAALVAAATRPNGIILALVAAVVAFEKIRRERRWESLLPVTLAPVGAFAFMLYLGQRTGDYFAWKHLEERVWNQTLNPGRWIDYIRWSRDPTWGAHWISSLLGLGLAAVLVWLLIRWKPPLLLSVYALALVALSILYPTVGFRPRFILAAFPLIVALARVLKPQTFMVVLASSAVLLGVYSIAATALPVNVIP